MVPRKFIRLSLALCVGVSFVSLAAYGQDEKPNRGRKYKAPPIVSHIEVTVTKAFNGKPIPNAAVVFHSIKDGKDEGNLEVKTDPDGKAIIDVIPTGSDVRVQVIANGFATYGEDYHVDTASRAIVVSMVRPQAQVSTYTDKIEQRKPGVQEPNRPTPPNVPAAGSTAPAPVPSPPAPSTPPAATNPHAGGSPQSL